jgi:hypothetical protein
VRVSAERDRPPPGRGVHRRGAERRHQRRDARRSSACGWPRARLWARRYNETNNRFFTVGGDTGLRGYTIADFAGQIRVLNNLELRTFPIRILFARFGGIAFWDFRPRRRLLLRLRQPAGPAARRRHRACAAWSRSYSRTCSASTGRCR